ncbi:MAG: hypothetical protein R3C58_15545 [Parvularculaceae bacterium]
MAEGEEAGVQALSVIAWAAWGVLVLGFLLTAVLAPPARRTPEVGEGLGAAVIAIVFAVLAGAAGLIVWAASAGSFAGLAVLTVLLVWPAALMIARPLVLAWKARRAERDADEPQS